MTIHLFLVSLLGKYAEYAWVIQAFIIFFTIFTVYMIQKRFMHRLHLRLERTRQVWDDTLVKAFARPFSVVLWFIGLTYMVHYLFVDFHIDEEAMHLKQIRIAGLVVIFVWFVWRYIVEIEKRLVHPANDFHQPVDQTTAAVVGRLAKIFLFAVTVLIVLHLMGAPLTGLLAFGGGSAIAMGIAEKNIEGTVQRIGWRTTKVLTLDKRPLYIPNSIFAKIVIANPQRMTHRRMNVDVGVRYDDASKMPAIIDDIRAMLKLHPKIDQRENVLVHFTTFAESSLGINVYCFTKVIDFGSWRDLQQEIYMKILAIIDRHGAQMAFPTRTIEIKNKEGFA
jgi:MscS family membrane protein